MNNIRDKFELKISMEYEQPPCLDRDGDGYDDSHVDNAWWGWQAATEQSQKEIAELKASEKVLVKALESAKYSVKAMRDVASKINPNVTSDNIYNLELESIDALLANVRGEVK